MDKHKAGSGKVHEFTEAKFLYKNCPLLLPQLFRLYLFSKHLSQQENLHLSTEISLAYLLLPILNKSFKELDESKAFLQTSIRIVDKALDKLRTDCEKLVPVEQVMTDLRHG